MNRPEPIRLFLCAPDNRLTLDIRAWSCGDCFDIVRSTSFRSAFAKATAFFSSETPRTRPSNILLAQWSLETIGQSVEMLATLETRYVASRFFVCLPELPKATPRMADEIRFTLLQMGASAVLSTKTELKTLLSGLIPKSL